ncbi:hypothetical protein GW17_00022410 [Ensete ventricosum]|nr:hypothetical protein GW17_00022410 [Ensete ventricosum]
MTHPSPATLPSHVTSPLGQMHIGCRHDLGKDSRETRHADRPLAPQTSNPEPTCCERSRLEAHRNKKTAFLRLEFRASGAGDEGRLDLSQDTFFCSGVCQGKVSSLYRLPHGCSVIVVVPSFGVRDVL